LGKSSIVGVVVVTVCTILSTLFQYFQWANITPAFLTPYTSLIVLSLALAAIIALVLYLWWHPKKSATPSLTSTEKKKSWFSKLRVPLRLDKRMDFLLTAIVLLIGGPILILMILSFPSDQIPPQAFTNYLAIKITSIIAGSTLTALGVWMASNLLLDIYENRKRLIADRENALLNIINDFDKSFRELKQATQQKIKKMLLDDFQNRLRNLCYDYPWSEEKRVRITEVLSYIPSRLADDPNSNSYLLFLGFIIRRDKDQTIKMVKEKFLVELETLYNDSRFETNPKPMDLLQELNEYSEVYMMKLVDDASSTSKWSPQKFQAIGNTIELWELKKKDIEAHARVSQYILRKLDDAEKNKDDETCKRLESLYTLSKR
jgi:hypothetical protein